MKVYGDKVLTGVYPCRFPDIHEERAEGGYQIELVVPKSEAGALQALLYNDDQKVINFNKATQKAKVPKKLWVEKYVYDEEAKETARDEEGEKIVDTDFVIFRFKSMWRPKIQYKKGLDNTAKVGAGSEVQIMGSVFGSDEKKDENNKPLKYVLLSLAGVRVHTLEEIVTSEVFEENDDFEDEVYTEDTSGANTETTTSEEPVNDEKDF
jgi:hypothetical protein